MVGERSGNCHASVDAEHGSGDEAAAGAEQEQHGVVQLAGTAAASERRPRQQEVRKLLRVIAQLRIHLGGEETRRHGVHADPVAAPLRRELAGQADDAGLGGNVGRVRDLPDRAQAHDRGDVDDRAATSVSHPLRGQARERERRDEVEIEDAGEVSGRGAQGGRAGAGAGVVDQAVEPARAARSRRR